MSQSFTCKVCPNKVDRYSPSKDYCSLQCKVEDRTESRSTNGNGSNLNDLSRDVAGYSCEVKRAKKASF